MSEPSFVCRLVLVGPPGVGKGTQAALLEARKGCRPISSGVIFRQEMEAETDLGRLARRYIDHGELVPNGVTIEMMAKRLRSEDVRKHGFVLDGFPRSLRQAEALDEILQSMESQLSQVISLEVPNDVLVNRLSGRIGCTKCGEIYHSISKPPRREGLCDKCNSPLIVRSDDKPDAIRERLRVFEETTAPVLDYYDKQRLVRRIDATKDPESVYSQIIGGGAV